MTKGIIRKTCWFCLVLINSVLWNFYVFKEIINITRVRTAQPSRRFIVVFEDNKANVLRLHNIDTWKTCRLV